MTDVHDLEGRTPEECFELARQAFAQAEMVVNSATSVIETSRAQAAAIIGCGWTALGEALSANAATNFTITDPEPTNYGHDFRPLSGICRNCNERREVVGEQMCPVVQTEEPTARRAHRWPTWSRDGQVHTPTDVRCLACGRCEVHQGAECVGETGSSLCQVCLAEEPTPGHEHSTVCLHAWVSPGEPCRECEQPQSRNQPRCPAACPEPGDFWSWSASRNRWVRD